MSLKKEMKGITALKDMLYYSNIIDPYINENDKTPIWDGNLFIYEKPNTGNKDHKSENLNGIIPVQIKARTVNKLGNDTTSFTCKRSDLSIFERNGGVMYFVIQIDSCANTKIYYASLLPYDIKKILGNNKKKNVKFGLKHINANMILKFEDKCENFLIHRELQYSTKNNMLPFEDACELIFKGSTRHSTIEEYILNNEMYIYGIKNDTDQIPLMVGKGLITKIEKSICKSVLIDGIKYFEEYKVRHEKSGYSIIFGDNIVLNIQQGKFSFKYKFHDKIDKVKLCIEFMISTVRNNGIYIEDSRVDFLIENAEVELKKLIQLYNYLKDIIALFDLLSIDRNTLNMDSLEKKDKAYIDLLIDAMVYGNEVKLNVIKPSKYRFDIGNISIITFIEQTPNKLNRIIDFSKLDNKRFSLVFTGGESNKEVSYNVTPYIILDTEDLIKSKNIKLHKIKTAILESNYNEVISDAIVNFLLNMIRAYDKTRNSEFLQEALEICGWLKKNDPDNPVHIINEYQIKYRETGLTSEEKETLKDMIITHKNYKLYDQLLCSIYLLLEDNKSFIKIISKLTKEEKELFVNYPIYSLYNSK